MKLENNFLIYISQTKIMDNRTSLSADQLKRLQKAHKLGELEIKPSKDFEDSNIKVYLKGDFEDIEFHYTPIESIKLIKFGTHGERCFLIDNKKKISGSVNIPKDADRHLKEVGDVWTPDTVVPPTEYKVRFLSNMFSVSDSQIRKSLRKLGYKAPYNFTEENVGKVLKEIHKDLFGSN